MLPGRSPRHHMPARAGQYHHPSRSRAPTRSRRGKIAPVWLERCRGVDLRTREGWQTRSDELESFGARSGPGVYHDFAEHFKDAAEVQPEPLPIRTNSTNRLGQICVAFGLRGSRARALRVVGGGMSRGREL